MKEKKQKTDAKKSKVTIKDVISGEFLVRDFVISNLPYVFFVIFLMLLLVAKGYYGKQLIQNINQTQKRLDAVTTDYVESKAKLEEETSRGQLLKNLKDTNLVEATTPVKVIRIEKNK